MVSPLHHMYNLNPTAIHNSSPVPVEMECREGMQFKQCVVIRVLQCKIPTISIHHHMHAVYGNKCVDVSNVRHWVWQFKQKVGQAVVSGEIKGLFKGWNSKTYYMFAKVGDYVEKWLCSCNYRLKVQLFFLCHFKLLLPFIFLFSWRQNFSGHLCI